MAHVATLLPRAIVVKVLSVGYSVDDPGGPKIEKCLKQQKKFKIYYVNDKKTIKLLVLV